LTGVEGAGAFGPCSAYGEARFGLTVRRGLASGDGFAFGLLFKGEQDSRIAIGLDSKRPNYRATAWRRRRSALRALSVDRVRDRKSGFVVRHRCAVIYVESENYVQTEGAASRCVNPYNAPSSYFLGVYFRAGRAGLARASAP
jgi:hypothetical protein